ncbi:MAG TPA: AMP-binding protein [Nocardia sp.]|uniref:class I adenylate-forming enzyme family protein n=1 Tax=Nocardia sp. TaxID=1821 RepID=UPI002B4AFECB|nr:AMP-binding protein [Nocardia sp.]HLS75795.1 AMP-binding protein [Nocardia sp.]
MVLTTESANSSLIAALTAAARTHGSSPLRFHTAAGVSETTVGELLGRAQALAGWMQEGGHGPGTVAAVQVPNSVEAAVAYAAVLISGATLVPLVHIYGQRETEFVLGESGATLLLTTRQWRSIDYTERAPAFRAAGTRVELVDELAEAAGAYRAPADPEIAIVNYTSGTTAAPKGVQHTGAGVLAEIRSAPGGLGEEDEAVGLVSFPFGHIAGVVSLLRPLLLGRSTVFLDGWDADLALELIPRYRITSTSGTPLHLATLLDALEAGAELGSLARYLVGAATVPADLVARADRLGISAFRCYGSTEHPTVSSGTATDPLAKRQFTDGRPCAGVEVAIVDETGAQVPTGVDGEVICRGPETFAGYRDPALDAGTWLDRGDGGRPWLRTGDIGRLDAEGYLTITDRAKDVIIRAGETISSREVEDVLLGCPGVADAAAVAVPDPYYGEKVGAVVVPGPAGPPTLDDIRAHFAAAGMTRQKTPEYLDVRAALPRTAIGKVRKADLRRELGEKLNPR